jgi:hypothetical protein
MIRLNLKTKYLLLQGGTPSTPTRRLAAGEILHQRICTLRERHLQGGGPTDA